MELSTTILNFLTKPNNINLNQVVSAVLPNDISGNYRQAAAHYKAIIKKNPSIDIYDVISNKQESSLIKNLSKNKQAITHPLKHYQVLIDNRLNVVVDQAISFEEIRRLKPYDEIRILNIIKGYIACVQSTNNSKITQKKHLLNHMKKFIDKIDLLEKSRHHLICSSNELDILNTLIYKLHQAANIYAYEIITKHDIYTATDEFKKTTKRLLTVARYRFNSSKQSTLSKIICRMKSIVSAVVRLVAPPKTYSLLASKFTFLANIPKPATICEDMLKHIPLFRSVARPLALSLPTRHVNFLASDNAPTRTQRTGRKMRSATVNQTFSRDVPSNWMRFFENSKKAYRRATGYTEKSSNRTKSIFPIKGASIITRVKTNKAKLLSMLKRPDKKQLYPIQP